MIVLSCLLKETQATVRVWKWIWRHAHSVELLFMWVKVLCVWT